MCPSTEPTPEEREFARDVLRNLLQYIGEENARGRPPIRVSHAWIEGTMMCLVYETPPSDIAWGLARDTKESIIDPAPWPDLDEAVRYYYLLDLEEGRMSASFRPPGGSDIISWRGDAHADLPERTSNIPDKLRYISAPETSVTARSCGRGQDIVNEPRRYVDPREPGAE